jgi:histone-lysine N-methyltransferase SETD3
MKDGGAKFDKLKLRYYSENYRGVHASQDIKNGECLLKVPLSQIITLEMGFKSPIGKLMYEKGLRNRLISPKHSFLCAYILQEKKKAKQEFVEFLDILPKSFEDYPIFFTEEEREFLKGSPFLSQIHEKIEDIKTDYNLICKEVPEFGAFTLREYSEARVMVSSRIFGITVNNVKTDGFVPLADMLNHRRPRQTTWYYDDSRDAFIIDACDDIPRGQQVYDSYGRKCNSRFFLNYGFINLNNDADEVPITVAIDKSDPGYEVKIKLINEKVDWKKFRVVENLEDPIMHEFLSWVRYVTYDGDLGYLCLQKNQAVIEAQKKRQQNGQDSDEDDTYHDDADCFKGTSLKPINMDSEMQMWTKIKELCLAQLALYPTTLE